MATMRNKQSGWILLFVVLVIATTQADASTNTAQHNPFHRNKEAHGRSSSFWNTFIPRRSLFKQQQPVDSVGLASNFGAAICACVDLVHDWDDIGHHHGIFLLCTSKLCREVNSLRGVVEETEHALHLDEDLQGNKVHHDTGVVRRRHRSTASVVQKLSDCGHLLFEFLSSRKMTILLSLAALAAAFTEVFQDIFPGGHHGAVLLATYELLELLEASHVGSDGVLHFFKNHAVRLVLASGASVMALVETIGIVELEVAAASNAQARKLVGAHHGVLVLAMSKMLYCIGKLRESLKEEKEDTEEEDK